MSYTALNSGKSSDYVSSAADRSNRITAQIIARINGINPAEQERVKQQLRDLQRQQIDDICRILERSGISDPRTDITTIDDVNNLFKNLGLSGGRKSTRRKTRKSRKSMRRR